RSRLPRCGSTLPPSCSRTSSWAPSRPRRSTARSPRSACRAGARLAPCRRSRASCGQGRLVAEPSVVVLDYGFGNVRSAVRALEHVGAKVELTADLDTALAADGL